MTETEQIADVVVAAVRVATAALVTRCAELDAKVLALEARAPVPGPAGEKGDRGETGPKGHDGMHGVNGKDGADGLHGKDAPAVDVDDIARRAAVLVPKAKDGADGRDGQPGVPGVPGRDGSAGERGEKGLDGAPGRDGTLEGVTVKQIGDRDYQLVRPDGAPIGVFKVESFIYRGVYVAGTKYEKGDSVTFGGSLWFAKDATSEKPGEGVTKWQLAVKAGREGREGKPGKDGSPGPRGEKGDPGRNFS